MFYLQNVSGKNDASAGANMRTVENSSPTGGGTADGSPARTKARDGSTGPSQLTGPILDIENLTSAGLEAKRGSNPDVNEIIVKIEMKKFQNLVENKIKHKNNLLRADMKRVYPLTKKTAPGGMTLYD